MNGSDSTGEVLNFRVTDDVWEEVGRDLDEGVVKAARHYGFVDEAAFARLLKEAGLKLGKSHGQSWLERHWLDVALAALAVVIAWLAWRAVM